MYILFLFFNRESYLFSEEPVEMHTQIHTQSLRNTHTKEPSEAHAHTHTLKKHAHTRTNVNIFVYIQKNSVQTVSLARARVCSRSQIIYHSS